MIYEIQTPALTPAAYHTLPAKESEPDAPHYLLWMEPRGFEFTRPSVRFVRDDAQHGFADRMKQPVHLANDPVGCAMFTDALVVGHRWVATRDGKLYGDTMHAAQRVEAMSTQSQNPHGSEHSFIRKTGQGYETDRLQQEPVGIDEPVLLLTGAEPLNYGHWLTKMLMKLPVAQQLELQDRKILVYCPFEWQKQLLARFGVTEDRIIPQDLNAVYHCRDLAMIGQVNSAFILDTKTLEFYDRYKREMLKLDVSQPPQNTLYVSRLHAGKKHPNYRLFANEMELIEKLQAEGAEIIEPENMPFEEVIKRFHAARLIIGPSGAGMFNTLFCQPGATVISFESFPYWISGHANLFASRGLHYAFITGDADPNDSAAVQKRWTLNIEGAMDAMMPYLRAHCPAKVA